MGNEPEDTDGFGGTVQYLHDLLSDTGFQEKAEKLEEARPEPIDDYDLVDAARDWDWLTDEITPQLDGLDTKVEYLERLRRLLRYFGKDDSQ